MPLKLPTTTPTPDEIFDVWVNVLSHAELKVLLYIVRRTLGFGKMQDQISYSQFMDGIIRKDGTLLDHGCGVKNRTNLTSALHSLEERGLVRAVRGLTDHGGKGITRYSLWFEENAEALLQDPRRGVIGAQYRSSTTPASTEVRLISSTAAVPTRNRARNRITTNSPPLPPASGGRRLTRQEKKALAESPDKYFDPNAKYPMCRQCGALKTLCECAATP